MENKFKIGDKVFHILYGWGNIKDVMDDGVMIYFDDMINQVSLFKKHFKLISFTEYTLEGFSQERPEELPKKGQVVWVRDFENEEWCIRYFVHKFESEYYVTSRNPFAERQNGSYYKYMTIKNPYEDEQ